MNVGVYFAPPAYNVDPALFASKAEELGFESIWYAEHPILPVYTSSSFPGSDDGIVPENYAHFADPFIALARASGATSTIKIGTSIALITERNPLLLAKEIATLDLFSRGRFLFGIGTGWHREETQIMGGDFDHRWTQAREAIQVMKELWSKEQAEFHGKYYDFPLVKSNPKPFQKPHPPIILGGKADNVLKRVVKWGDGWLPNRIEPSDIEKSRVALDKLAKDAGRDPRSISISPFQQPGDLDLIRAFHDAGSDRVVVTLDSPVSNEALSDALSRLADKVLK